MVVTDLLVVLLVLQWWWEYMHDERPVWSNVIARSLLRRGHGIFHGVPHPAATAVSLIIDTVQKNVFLSCASVNSRRGRAALFVLARWL
jgi:hypothetical protein